jgi:hypothetical protein
VATAFARLPLSEQLDLLLGGGTHAAPSATRASGDLVVRSATLEGHDMVMAAFDWTRSRGSIGPAEATQLGEALALAATRGVPLVFLMNTSGMRVTEGMQTVVALRTLLRGVLDARLAGQRMAGCGNEGQPVAAQGAGVPVGRPLGTCRGNCQETRLRAGPIDGRWDCSVEKR